jgi:exoribonuclease R
MNFKILIADRLYSDYKCININTEEVVDVSIENLFEKKFFNNDIMELKDNSIKEVQSPVRNANKIAGVLVLENNKTYGRTNNGKLLYKVIPDDSHLPHFLVPYELKMGFSKKFINKYITFQYKDWENKHPQGIIKDTLGDVNNLDVFFEYQLYCKSLHVSLSSFNADAKRILKQKTKDEYIKMILDNKDYNMIDRTNEYIFTIDSSTSTDLDDGFSIMRVEEGWKVSIYISNVFLWLETLHLWDSFAERVSTIYLPDRKRPMLPTVLSDTLCSLQENQTRFAMCLDTFINNDGEFINVEDYTIKNCMIMVSKNHSHGSKDIEKDTQYRELFRISKLLDYSVKTSHDLVSYWMVVMNMYVASVMNKKKIGIFRTAFIKNKDLLKDIPVDLPEDSFTAIKLWNNSVGKYVLFDEGLTLEHELIKSKVFHINSLNSYLHITSPIRRLVDLLNQIILFHDFKVVNKVSENALEFLEKWKNKIEYINVSMRCIRRVQVDCNILARFYNDSELLCNQYKGIVFDKVMKTDGMFSYMVYLQEFKILSRITTSDDFDNYSSHIFKIFLFEDEEKVKRKIRLQYYSKCI